jgi:hypothetical protein
MRSQDELEVKNNRTNLSPYLNSSGAAALKAGDKKHTKLPIAQARLGLRRKGQLVDYLCH